MLKSGIDQEALINMFAQTTAKQGEALRKAVTAATLKALQSRELTLENVRKVVKSVTQATSVGASRNPGSAQEVESLLKRSLAGMDSALLQTVEAHRKALDQFVERGAGLQEKQMKEALANIEKVEDVFFAAVTKVTQASGPLQAPWEQALSALKIKGTDTGNQAQAVVEQLMNQAQAALREGRSNGLRAAQALLDSYTALVSGVLIGMSEGLQGRGESPAKASPAAKSKRR